MGSPINFHNKNFEIGSTICLVRPFDPQTITRQDQRRMSNCLQAAGWERAGKYSSGSKRNQVRFVRPTIASEP